MQRWVAPILAILIAGCTIANPTSALAADDSPPQIAGRVSLAEGDAQIWRVEEDNDGEWDEAQVNDVVSPGTGLYTGNGRTEVRVGPNTFRFDANSRGGFSQLDYSNAVFNVEYGALNVRLARPEHGERTEITASGVQLDLAAPGRYRIDVTDRGPVRLTVFEGYGTVRSSTGSTGVNSSQAIVVEANGAGFNYEQAIATDFDQWAAARDENFSNVRSAQYVSPYMTGYEELDRYGDWTTDATYGTVWYPRVVPVGWAPYRHGQWRWVRPWGWTWVDHAPWGYAPFHYGRWLYAGHRWCWVPGGYVRRPVWGPAFVGFVGSSAGDRIWGGVRGPLVGWYPLAPWNRYEPHYRHNLTYATVINQTIVNRRPHGVPPTVNHGPGATMVPGPRFREPVTKVALQERPKVEELKAVAPPPLNVAPPPRSPSRKFAEQGQRGIPEQRATLPQQPATPPQHATPPQQHVPPPRAGGPTRVSPPITAEPIPGRGVTPPPAIPGNDPEPLKQPPGLKRVQPAPPVQALPQPPPHRPPPRAHMPSDQIPPGQPKPINPAEPARFPPGAPPTIRQGMAPPAKPVHSAPRPAAVAAPPAMARPAPRAAAPAPVAPPAAAVPVPAAPPAPPPKAAPPAKAQPQSPKEQAIRSAQENPASGRGNSGGPGRGKQP